MHILLLTGLFVVLWAATSIHGKRLESLHHDDPPPSDAFQSLLESNPQDRLVQPGDKPTSTKELAPTRLPTPSDKPQFKDQKSPSIGGHSDQSLMDLIDSQQQEINRLGEQVIQLKDDLARSEADNSRLRQQANMYEDMIRAMTDDAKPEGMSNATILEKYVMLNRSLSTYVHEAEATNYSEHNLTNIKDGSRRRRDTEAECLEDQYWDGDKCTACFCAAGEQSTAKTCGSGSIAGEPGCEACPDGTYRSGTDRSLHCSPCSGCDPDATVTSNCTKIADTLCACKEGMGFIGIYCVSCEEHPEAKDCPVERANTSISTPEGGGPKPKPSGSDTDSTGLIVGMLVLGLVIGIGIGICIGFAIKTHCKGSRQGDHNRDGNGRDGQDPSLENGVETPLNQVDATNHLAAPPESASPSRTPVASPPSAGGENRTNCCSIDMGLRDGQDPSLENGVETPLNQVDATNH